MDIFLHVAGVSFAIATTLSPWSDGPVLGSWGFAFYKAPAALELFASVQRFGIQVISFLLFLGLATSCAALLLLSVERLANANCWGMGWKTQVIHYSRATLLICTAIVEIVAAIAFVYGFVLAKGQLYLGTISSGIYLSAATSLISSLALTFSQPRGGGEVLVAQPPMQLPVAQRVAGAGASDYLNRVGGNGSVAVMSPWGLPRGSTQLPAPQSHLQVLPAETPLSSAPPETPRK